jgi:hypothetical protein
MNRSYCDDFSAVRSVSPIEDTHPTARDFGTLVPHLKSYTRDLLPSIQVVDPSERVAILRKGGNVRLTDYCTGGKLPDKVGDLWFAMGCHERQQYRSRCHGCVLECQVRTGRPSSVVVAFAIERCFDCFDIMGMNEMKLGTTRSWICFYHKLFRMSNTLTLIHGLGGGSLFVSRRVSW